MKNDDTPADTVGDDPALEAMALVMKSLAPLTKGARRWPQRTHLGDYDKARAFLELAESHRHGAQRRAAGR